MLIRAGHKGGFTAFRVIYQKNYNPYHKISYTFLGLDPVSLLN